MTFQVIGTDPASPEQLCFNASEEDFKEFLANSHLSSHTASASGMTPGGGLTPGGTTSDDSDDWHVLERRASEPAKYSIVSIMGAQSTGKSTALNRTFGTGFKVLDSRKGFGQTTMGIWFGDSPKAKDVLIMDLEGSDSAARSKNRENFERQVSLMALTLAEVLIINIKATEMGRASGMQLDTLKAVFEANMRLFNPKAKTLLLYLFRFYVPYDKYPGFTPKEILSEQMKRNILRVWDEVEKPDAFKGRRFSDMFDLGFFFLPDFAYFPDEFEASVSEFRSRFADPRNDNYYFGTDYHFRKSPLIADLCQWSRQLWDVVVSDEELNIPDQQKMLAAYRCDAALKEAVDGFSERLKVLKTLQREQGFVGELGQKLNVLIAEANGVFYEMAHRYDAEEFSLHMAKLTKEVENEAWKLFDREKAYIMRVSIDQFRHDLRNEVPSGKCADNFKAIVESLVEAVRSEWKERIKAATIETENKDFLDKDEFWNDMSHSIDESLRAARVEQFGRLEKEFQSLLSLELAGPMAHIFRNVQRYGSKVWPLISDIRLKFHAEGFSDESPIVRKLKNLMYVSREEEEKLFSLRSGIDGVVLEKCMKFGDEIEKVLIHVFDASFKKDSEGIPRGWVPGTDIPAIFKEAKQTTLAVVDDVFRNFHLRGDEPLRVEAVDTVLVAEDQIVEAIDTVTRHCDNEFCAATDRMHQKEFGGGLWPHHPLQWAVLLFFGWNELWTLATNPLYLITGLFAAVVAFVGFQAHSLGVDVQSVVWNTFGAAFNQLLRKFEDMQKAHMKSVERTTGRTPQSFIKRKSRTKTAAATPGAGDGIELTDTRSRKYD